MSGWVLRLTYASVNVLAHTRQKDGDGRAFVSAGDVILTSAQRTSRRLRIFLSYLLLYLINLRTRQLFGRRSNETAYAEIEPSSS